MIRPYLTLVVTFLAYEAFAQMTPVSPSGPGASVATIEAQSGTTLVPLTIRLSGKVKSVECTAGNVAGITFSIYAEEEGGVPLWSETQNVLLDTSGRYAVALGRMSNSLPLDIFASGNARWIEVLCDGNVETPRMQIVSVPYALSTLNAERLGGHPASDFALIQRARSAIVGSAPQPDPEPIPIHLPISLPQPVPQTDAAFAQLDITNTFQVKQFFRGGITLLPAVQAQSGDTNGQPSSGLDLVASAFNTATSESEGESFRWQTEAVGSNSTNPSGRLNLLFGVTGSTLAETGLSINADGTANFVPGQQVPLSAIQGALAAAGLLDPVTGGSPQTPVVNTGAYQWQQTPASGSGTGSTNKGAIQVGANTVTLSPCPKGVNGNDVWHYLYISGTGTPEAVLITGGSCTSGAQTGTIEFSAVKVHPAGYSIGTATGGVQEAVIAAAIPQSSGQTSRNVQMSPGSLVFNARLSIRTSGLTINGTGTTVVCAVQDTCIMLGDPSTATLASNITLEGVTISSNIPRSSWPAVEDNAQGSLIDKLRGSGTVAGNTFKSLIQIDNDQAAQINNLNTNAGQWSLCDATYCSTAIVGAGPAGSGKNAGVIWVSNSNLSLECTANGIDNQNGNTLQIQNSVVQAYPEFGVRSEVTYSNMLNVELQNVYTEIGNCVNPLGTGMAGLIVENGFSQVNTSTGPAGQLPQYSNSGTIPFAYYIVVHSSQMGVSPVYLAGNALSDGTSTIPVKWNQVGTAGVITYDVLRVSANSAYGSTAAPYGTGNFAVATGVTTANCSNMVCTFVDNPAANASSYTVQDSFYSPALTLWPAGVVLTTRWDTQNLSTPTRYFTDTITGNSFVNSTGGLQPSVFAQECEGTGNWSSIWMQCQEGDGYLTDNAGILGTLIQLAAYGGQTAGLKGRTIYELPTDNSSIPGTEIITLGDSNFDKTTSTPSNRPAWDSNDTYVGLDQPHNQHPSQYQLAFGAPVSISNYVSSIPDGTNWKERLTSSLKSFTVPISAAAYLTSSDCASAVGVCGSAPAGKVAIATGTTSITVSTTQVTATSEIHIDENFSYGPVLGVSCDITLGRHYAISVQTPGEGFTVITDAAPANGAACLSFSIEN